MNSGPETLDKSMTTYFNRPYGEDPFAYHPWRSPGAAEIFSPCGVAGREREREREDPFAYHS